MIQSRYNLDELLFKPTEYIGLGGGGRDVALYMQSVRIRRICQLLGIKPENIAETKRIETLVSKLSPAVFIDSDRWESIVFEPRFGIDEAQTLKTPLDFEPLSSPSGRAIIEEVQTEPYQHLEQWEQLEHLSGKASNSQAQGSRLYGLTNALVNTIKIEQQLSDALKNLNEATKGAAWQELAEYSLPFDTEKRIHIMTSVAGGQGAGLIVYILCQLAELIKRERADYEIFLSVFLPGFHESDVDNELGEKMFRALSVLRDLEALQSGAEIEIRYPREHIKLSSRQTEELYDLLFVHLPRPSEIGVYESFISRTAETIVDAELSPVAAGLRKQRSNAKDKAQDKQNYNGHNSNKEVKYDESIRKFESAAVV
ncbi:MAG TPA: tubulin-like doman-containing protein [Pyrinomonadaceae bacterium]|nr:tubulin-like doman-containing protein [Pyrinomonadaceae bacterium]